MVAVLGLFTLAACGGSSDGGSSEAQSSDWSEVVKAAEEEGALTWYTSMPVEEATKVLEKFEESYPSIKTELARSGTGAGIEKFETEVAAGVNQVDVIQVALLAPYEEWKKNGLISKVDLPAAKDIPAEYQDPDGYWYVQAIMAYMLMYNSNAVSEAEAPQKWEELLDPKFKGRVGMNPPWRSGAPTEWAYMLENELKVPDFLDRWAAQDPLLSSGHGDLADAIVRGEIDLAPMLDYQFYASNKSGAPVGATYPEGTIANPRMLGVVAEAPHPNAARLFVNWTLTLEAQQFLADLMGSGPVHPDVKVAAPMQTLEGKKVFFHDPADIAAAQDDILSRWEKKLTK